MPFVRLTSKSYRNWRTHPEKGDPMTPKKLAIRTRSFAMCHIEEVSFRQAVVNW
jgi:hypothetical protein